MDIKSVGLIALCTILFSVNISQSTAQDRRQELRIQIEPEQAELKVGQELQLQATVIDSAGTVLPDSVIFYSRDGKSVSASSKGVLKAHRPGKAEIIAYKPPQNGNGRLAKRFEIRVPYPPLDNISFVGVPEKIYAGTSFPLEMTITDVSGYQREDLEVENIESSDPSVAEITPLNKVKAKKTGSFSITATYKNLKQTLTARVVENPVVSLRLEADRIRARTGDVIHFKAMPKDDQGHTVENIPVTYTFTATDVEGTGVGASALIKYDGRFVANRPGTYTILAKVGNRVDEQSVVISPRNVQRNIEVVGHGRVSDVNTSDLWVWEGVDGRDYAATGTWGANGEAYFWDVTDPADMQIIDTVTVDARTVNDVKVSEDGRIAVITREGASDRKNGLVILDVTDPANVEILSRFDEGLTGGVHNVFVYQDHIYAVNNGRRYDIINIEDPANPYRVSRFELDTPGHSVHDVWVEEGIAYSSNWDDGVVAVDVGSDPKGELGSAGGSPRNPKKLGSFTYPSGWNHAAFPFKSRSTGDFYIIAGDEAFPGGQPAGWIHFFKLDDWNNSEEVARYEVPEAGTHNMWVKDDVLYIAYYQGGLRVVDISGELLGNLYEQGREIARFLPRDPEGFEANSPLAWGPQPYKGYIFISDMNSGLWALKLQNESNVQQSN